MATSGTGRRTQWANAAGSHSSLVFSLLPGGATALQIGAGVLSDTNGRAISCVRASPKYCRLNSLGSALALLGNNQPAVEPEGLSVEQASTNLILWSQDLTNAVWTKRGSATISAGVHNAPDGSATANHVSGLDAAVVGDFFQNTASTGAASTASFWIWRTSTTGTLVVQSPTGPTDGTYTINMALLPDAWSIVDPTNPAVTVTTAYGAAAAGLQFKCTSGAPLAFDIWTPQLEALAFRTSPIATTTVAVTRDHDNCTATLLRAIGPTPSFSCDFTSKDIGFSDNPVGLSVYNSGSDRWGVFALSGGQLDVDYNNGSEFSSITPGGVITANTSAHLVASYDGTNMNAAVNGSNTATARSFTATSLQANAAFGWSGWSNQNWLNGWVSNVKIYSKASAAK